LSIAVIPWGVLTGALAVQAGFSPLQAQVLSLIVFAGAAQLSSITQLASGVTFASIFVSTFVISSRHLLYSLSFRQHVSKCSFLMRTSIAFLLTDEMFAVSETHTKRSGAFSAKFALVSGFFFERRGPRCLRPGIRNSRNIYRDDVFGVTAISGSHCNIVKRNHCDSN